MVPGYTLQKLLMPKSDNLWIVSFGHGNATLTSIDQCVEGDLDTVSMPGVDTHAVGVSTAISAHPGIEKSRMKSRVVGFDDWFPIYGDTATVFAGDSLPPATVEAPPTGKYAIIEHSIQCLPREFQQHIISILA